MMEAGMIEDPIKGPLPCKRQTYRLVIPLTMLEPGSQAACPDTPASASGGDSSLVLASRWLHGTGPCAHPVRI